MYANVHGPMTDAIASWFFSEALTALSQGTTGVAHYKAIGEGDTIALRVEKPRR